MAFKLFEGAKYSELVPYIEDIKGTGFGLADIWVDVDRKDIIVETRTRRFVVNYSDYDKLLATIVNIARELYFNDMLEALNLAKHSLTTYRSHPQLEMEGREVVDLLVSIERVKEYLINGNFTVRIKLGDIRINNIDDFVKSHPEIRKTVNDAIERYRELCWKSGDFDELGYCDRVVPDIYERVYIIPEDKRIIIDLVVDQIGEVYGSMKGYDDSYSFLKDIEEYKHIIGAH